MSKMEIQQNFLTCCLSNLRISETFGILQRYKVIMYLILLLIFSMVTLYGNLKYLFVPLLSLNNSSFLSYKGKKKRDSETKWVFF